jgi:hypothetical protein
MQSSGLARWVMPRSWPYNSLFMRINKAVSIVCQSHQQLRKAQDTCAAAQVCSWLMKGTA